jgi:tetratricopeptide (TPR) repeat protein
MTRLLTRNRPLFAVTIQTLWMPLTSMRGGVCGLLIGLLIFCRAVAAEDTNSSVEIPGLTTAWPSNVDLSTPAELAPLLPGTNAPNPAKSQPQTLFSATLPSSTNQQGERISQPPPTPAETKTAPAPEKVVASDDLPPEMNPALLHGRDILQTTNIFVDNEETRRRKALDALQTRLETARHQHLTKQYDQACANFIAIIEGESPDEFKRISMMELAIMAQEQNQLAKANQIFAQYLNRWPKDFSVPEVLLRQGLIYRQMGLNNLAISKFYAVMTSALVLKAERYDYYQRLVLQSQTEIAETQMAQGKYNEAADSLSRLLKLESPALNRPVIQFKLIRSLGNTDRYEDLVAESQDFLIRNPNASEQSEVRFLIAKALQHLGRNGEALQQVLTLLRKQKEMPKIQPETIAYWQQRAGNEIANQFYREGDYVKALEIFLTLSALDPAPSWQIPVWYQIGLIYEKLEQPTRAVDFYQSIVGRQSEIGTNGSPALKAVVEMAQWRKDYLTWQFKTDNIRRELRETLGQPAGSNAAESKSSTSKL